MINIMMHFAGVKKCGVVSSAKTNHMWNWFEVKGVKYYCDYQSWYGGNEALIDSKSALKAGL